MLSKRIFDLVCVSFGLILLAPLLLLVALLIKYDSPGPLLFLQQRVGRDGRLFKIIKFRSMGVDAEAGGQLTVGADTRVTRVGRTLRRYKLDELPQCWNVLRGEMSLVGPRPEVPRYVACYPEALRATVLSVAPGMTDWAAIRFRDESAILASATDPERIYVDLILPIKLDYYVRYVRNRSLMMDVKIILFTLFALAGYSGKRRSV